MQWQGLEKECVEKKSFVKKVSFVAFSKAIMREVGPNDWCTFSSNISLGQLLLSSLDPNSADLKKMVWKDNRTILNLLVKEDLCQPNIIATLVFPILLRMLLTAPIGIKNSL